LTQSDKLVDPLPPQTTEDFELSERPVEAVVESPFETVESPFETDKDLEREVEASSSVFVEEKQVLEEVEKDLQLTIDTENSDDMESQLNPDAKEFVPTSPVRTNGFTTSPLENGSGMPNPINSLLANFEDAIVAQSPRKGDVQLMEDVQVPEFENEFDQGADKRPHEVDLLDEHGGFQRIESPEVLNLKESMQQDDKLTQEYKDEAFFEEEQPIATNEYKVLESSFDQYSSGFQNKIDDPMNRSFYEGRDSDILANGADVLNTVQPIPSFDEDEQPEADHHFEKENDKPEADLLGNELEYMSSPPPQEPVVVQAVNEFETSSAISMEASNDNFEAEKFVEGIKEFNGAFDKYVDTGLSPTIPQMTFDSAFTSQSLPVAQEVPEIKEEYSEPPPTPAVDVAEPILSPEPLVEAVKVDEPNVEAGIVAAAAAALTVAIASEVTTKKKPASSKPEVKKAEVKPKTGAAAKPSAAPAVAAKKAPSTTLAKTAAAKPLSAAAKPAAPAKVPAARPPTSASTLRAKPMTTTTTASTLTKKPSTGTVPKPAASDVKPTPAARTTAALPKKPATSVAATK